MTENFSKYMRMAIDQGKQPRAGDDGSHIKVGVSIIVRGGECLGSAYGEEQGSREL